MRDWLWSIIYKLFQSLVKDSQVEYALIKQHLLEPSKWKSFTL